MGHVKGWVTAVVFVVLTACAGSDPSAPASPSQPRPTPPDAPGSTPSGFDQVEARVRTDDGTDRSFCVWRAADDAARARGLQGVTSLGECPGMAFVYPEPVEHRFWMRDTLIPLTITFWDAAGRFVSSAEMEPCPAAAPDCPLTAAAGPYQLAIEVPRGDAATLGLVAGSTVTLGPGRAARSGIRTDSGPGGSAR
jgi:uncharacterized membrane protein (UPF0127 family)